MRDLFCKQYICKDPWVAHTLRLTCKKLYEWISVHEDFIRRIKHFPENLSIKAVELLIGFGISDLTYTKEKKYVFWSNLFKQTNQVEKVTTTRLNDAINFIFDDVDDAVVLLQAILRPIYFKRLTTCSICKSDGREHYIYFHRFFML